MDAFDAFVFVHPLIMEGIKTDKSPAAFVSERTGLFILIFLIRTGSRYREYRRILNFCLFVRCRVSACDPAEDHDIRNRVGA